MIIIIIMMIMYLIITSQVPEHCVLLRQLLHYYYPVMKAIISLLTHIIASVLFIFVLQKVKKLSLSLLFFSSSAIDLIGV